MKPIKTVGIIGLGSFGKFAGELLQKHVSVLGYSPSNKQYPGITRASLETTAKADAVILGIPFKAYPTVLEELAKYLPPETLLIDVCSVKVKPTEQIEHFLPNHPNLLMTHPLFGPETYHNANADHVIVVTESRGDTAQAAEHFCSDELGLQVKRITAEEHDIQMAKIHALTYFIARGLTEVGVEESDLGTPSYQSLLQLTTLDQKHTQELFETIENANPYAATMRKEYLKALQSINDSLTKQI